MKEVVVSEIYNVTQISKNNDEAWKKMIDIADNADGDVLFDFDGIELNEPFNNNYFMKLMANTRVHMRIYNDKETANTVELALRFGNIPGGRIENIEYFENYDPKAEKNDRQIAKTAERISENTYKDGSILVIDVGSTFEQISDVSTVDAIAKIIKDSVNIGEAVEEFRVDINGLVIRQNILERLAHMSNQLRSEGIKVTFASEDEDMLGKLTLFTCSKNLSNKERERIITEAIGVNTVGVIHKFKKTKKRDIFGRSGDGESIVVRAAIYKGIKDGKVILETFNGSYFHTRVDYCLENDMAEHPGLTRETWSIPLGDMGFCNLFLGGTFHFNMPIQENQDDYVTLSKVKYNKDGGSSVTTFKVTVPEHIKIVLDDFGVSYNAVALMEAIRETKDILGIR